MLIPGLKGLTALCIPTRTSAIVLGSCPEMGTNSNFPLHFAQLSRISLSFRINNTTFSYKKQKFQQVSKKNFITIIYLMADHIINFLKLLH